ncbi:MAG: hypothetical protein ACE5HB_09555 [Terriglobia bacterium]
MKNYTEVYSAMSDDQLLHVAEQASAHTEEAREALDAELRRRGLGQQAIRAYAEESARIAETERRRTGDLMVVNGFGRMFYGKANYVRDERLVWEEYDTTMWLVFLWFPLIPMASYRIQRAIGSSTNPFWAEYPFTVLERLRLNWPQVGKTWLWALVVLFGIAHLLSSLG